MKRLNCIELVLALASLIVATGRSGAAPVGTAFTYQGRLADGSNAANGQYELQFVLFDAGSGGNPVGPTNFIAPLAVSNGQFTVALDFGGLAFDGNARWLEIGLRTNGAARDFMTLRPRQLLTPTPYALYALSLAPRPGATGLYATVGGGTNNLASGEAATVGGGHQNTSSGPEASVGGGSGNKAGGGFSTVAGGRANDIRSGAHSAMIGGGEENTIQDAAAYATIAGGNNNSIGEEAEWATIGGGLNNSILFRSTRATIAGGSENDIGAFAPGAFVGGGYLNSIAFRTTNAFLGGGEQNRIEASAHHAAIVGGSFNTNCGTYSTIGGGSGNAIGSDSSFSTIAGGEGHRIAREAWNNTISGGEFNLIETQADDATISGGVQNAIGDSADAATIGGGDRNRIGSSADFATVGGGYSNMSSNQFDTVGGGALNTSSGQYATVGGGQNNSSSGWAATVGGGDWNESSGYHTTVAGGDENTSSGYDATVGGGSGNRSSGPMATVGGGSYNWSSSWASTVPGGYQNMAGGLCSFAAGRRAKAVHDGAFVWGDSTDADVTSTNTNSWTVRASGGVTFYTDTNLSSGAVLSAGSGSWSSLSDRAAKDGVQPLDGRAVLEQLARLPLSTWRYRAQAPGVRHVGPMAQDFHAAFGVGEDERHISSVDADGVALAAIQGLNEKVESGKRKAETRIEQLEKENVELKARLAALEQLLKPQIQK